jgi:hypothetical protein
MERNDKLRIAKVLIKIGEKLESDKFFLSQLEKFVEDKKEDSLKEKLENLIDVDIFDVYSNESVENFKEILNNLTIENLIRIIKKNNFDTSKLSHKWKDKNRLVNLIIERVKTRMEKGKTFLEYDK